MSWKDETRYPIAGWTKCRRHVPTKEASVHEVTFYLLSWFMHRYTLHYMAPSYRSIGKLNGTKQWQDDGIGQQPKATKKHTNHPAATPGANLWPLYRPHTFSFIHPHTLSSIYIEEKSRGQRNIERTRIEIQAGEAKIVDR
ncbi:hypothetical protein KQX54_020813 [Cotesia glomerata]|uniref:Uncharacterized protein n=1 Tax=Cotesia glomerata TaxID=32391 RepID=A0AAV7I556_COTGL|nr:hypothetical protein KQX54_020813 [Cotesia glomerata]